MRRTIIGTAILAVASGAVLPGQAARFEDVVRNLRNPDPKVRMSAVRLLREAKYPEAVVPLAPLINDPVEPIQLEAIRAQLAFFLVEEVPERRRLAFLVEVRNRGGARGAFELGPLAAWPRPVPPEVVAALLKAVDDEAARVRQDAIYALGTIAKPPLADEAVPPLIAALDHYDPEIRAGAARVIGRLGVRAAGGALIKAINDSSAPVRYAAMRALGALGEETAVTALTEQLTFYGRGEGAWSALDGLARIGHPSSVPLFAARLADRDPYIRRAAAEGLGRAGGASEIGALETGAGNDSSAMVRAAMAFALQKLGRHYVVRLVEFLDEARLTLQVQEYLLELGPPIEKELLPSLQEPDEAIRAAVADVLGEIGGDASLAALQPLQDAQARGRTVADAAARAIERIGMRRAS